MGDGDPKARQPALPAKTPKDIQDFIACTAAALTVKGGTVGWLGKIDLELTEIEPDISFAAGENGAINITVGKGMVALTVPASVVDGQLSIEVPSLLPQKATDTLRDWVKDLNAWLKANGKQFGQPKLDKGAVTLTKVALAAPPKATDKPVKAEALPPEASGPPTLLPVAPLLAPAEVAPAEGPSGPPVQPPGVIAGIDRLHLLPDDLGPWDAEREGGPGSMIHLRASVAEPFPFGGEATPPSVLVGMWFDPSTGLFSWENYRGTITSPDLPSPDAVFATLHPGRTVSEVVAERRAWEERKTAEQRRELEYRYEQREYSAGTPPADQRPEPPQDAPTPPAISIIDDIFPRDTAPPAAEEQPVASRRGQLPVVAAAGGILLIALAGIAAITFAGRSPAASTGPSGGPSTGPAAESASPAAPAESALPEESAAPAESALPEESAAPAESALPEESAAPAPSEAASSPVVPAITIVNNDEKSPTNPCAGTGTLHVAWTVQGAPAGATAVVKLTGPGVPPQVTFKVGGDGTFGRDFSVPSAGTWSTEVVSIAGQAPTANTKNSASSTCGSG
jgi:hypothetical protein